MPARGDDREFTPGMRIQLSALGKARSPRMKVHTGVIVGITHGSEGVRLILDGSKKPITLHKSYIEPITTDRHQGNRPRTPPRR